MKNYFFSLFLLIGQVSFTATVPSHLIAHADSIDNALTIRHQDLAEYLAIPAKDDREKVLIFAYWIAKNIRYDKNELKRLDRNKIPREVLDNKRAVCGGYSKLFEQLCEDESILSYTLSGYSYGNKLEQIFRKNELKHAWNVVFIEDKWQLVDVTWCTTIVRTKEFKENREFKWILMEPIEFAETHLPNDPAWQLLEEPRTKKAFWQKSGTHDLQVSNQKNLKELAGMTKIDGRLSSIKSQFAYDQDKKEYLDNLIRLAWDCSGGSSFDEERIKKGITIFKFADQELMRIEPITEKKKYSRMIRGGLYISKKRLENGE